MFPIPAFLRAISWFWFLLGMAGWFLFFFGSFFVTLAWGQQQYTLVDLGPGFVNAIADNAPLIVGQRQRQAAILSAPQQLLGWLPTSDNPYGYALGASAYGVVGVSSFISNIAFSPYPILWTPSGGLVNLLPNDRANAGGTFATDINDAGMIIGYGNGPGSTIGRGAFRFASTGGSSLLPDSENAQAWSINAYGDVTGHKFIEGPPGVTGMVHAMLWPITGGIVDLHPLAATRSQGVSINDAMLVCGNINGAGNSIELRGILWFDVESYRILQPLPGHTGTLCAALNNAGILVGQSGISHPVLFPSDRPYLTQQTAVRWSANSDQAEALQPLIVNDATGWQLWEATGINNAGIIVGNGSVNGEGHGWALVPYTPPAPSPIPDPPSRSPEPPPAVSGMARDMDGNGADDLVFQNTETGQMAVWYLNHGHYSYGGGLLTLPDPSWRLIGMGDVNGDGMPDLVWRHPANGVVLIWIMAGTQIASSISYPASLDYRLETLGDMNGDGLADLIWRLESTGTVYAWIMHQGGSIAQLKTLLPSSDTAWSIVAVGDVNNDGHNDLIWEHRTAGIIGYSGCTAGTPITWGIIEQNLDTNWRLKVAADINGDGQTDFVFRHLPTGMVASWYLQGGRYQRSEVIETAAGSWQMR